MAAAPVPVDASVIPRLGGLARVDWEAEQAADEHPPYADLPARDLRHRDDYLSTATSMQAEYAERERDARTDLRGVR